VTTRPRVAITRPWSRSPAGHGACYLLIVRWIVSIIAAVGLLIAAGTRTDPRQPSGPDTQQLYANHGATATPARRGGNPHHVRLAAFVTSDDSQPFRLDRVVAAAAATPLSPVLEQHAGSVSIRGPPLG
jgi:hypothetical protein